MSVYNVLVLWVLVGTLDGIWGHGRLWEPPSRSSMWRRGYNTSINIDDNELSCGGFTNQWIVNKGRCGVCGDPYQQSKPRDNENGGIYSSGLIARTYPVGSVMDVVIGLTANHGGYFEFKLCPLFDALSTESHECMDKHRLAILGAGGDGYEYHIRDHLLVGEVRLSVMLPAGLFCSHCVLQWKYRTGTRWGCDAAELCGHGLGPQEEFYGCADIAIADVPNMVHLVPKQAENQDKVGLNDLGSKHHRKLGTNDSKMASDKPIIKFVAHKSASYNSTTKSPGEENSTISTKNVSAEKTGRLMLFMEDLVLNSIRNYYNTVTDDKHTGVTCVAVVQYKTNPIINEWCRKTCSKEPSLCPPSICKCAKILPRHNSARLQQSPKHVYTDDQERLRSFAKELISQSKKNDVTQSRNNTSTVDDIIATLPVPQNMIVSSKLSLLRKHLLNDVDSGLSNPRAGRNPPSDHTPISRTGKTSHKIQSHSERTEPTETSNFRCTASKKFAHNEFMANWCTKNCSFGFCPRMVCTCSS